MLLFLYILISVVFSDLEIRTFKELFEFSESIASKTYEGETVSLKNDIVIGSQTMWMIGTTDKMTFKGTFDGENHKISGTISGQAGVQYVGLFGVVVSGTIKNLEVAVNISGFYETDTQSYKGYGGLVGYCKGCTVENCHQNMKFIIPGGYNAKYHNAIIGGIVARAEGATIKNCSKKNDLSNSYVVPESSADNVQIGGIVGYAEDTTIENCSNEANITGTVSKVFSSALYSQPMLHIGGIAGFSGANLEIINCQNYGKISGSNKVNMLNFGGIIGTAGENTKITSCLNEGNIFSLYSTYFFNLGGIVSAVGNGSEISKCKNSGSLTYDEISDESDDCDFGGIVSYSDPENAVISIVDCENTGSIESFKSAGGIFSTGKANIKNCINRGKIEGRTSVGGIVYNLIEGSINQCKNYGSITALGQNIRVAGIASFASTDILNCINSGNIKGRSTINNDSMKYASISGIIAESNNNGINLKNNINTGSLEHIADFEYNPMTIYIGGIVAKGINLSIKNNISDCNIIRITTLKPNIEYNFGYLFGYLEATITTENCFYPDGLQYISTESSVTPAAIPFNRETYRYDIDSKNVIDTLNDYANSNNLCEWEKVESKKPTLKFIDALLSVILNMNLRDVKNGIFWGQTVSKTDLTSIISKKIGYYISDWKINSFNGDLLTETPIPIVEGMVLYAQYSGLHFEIELKINETTSKKFEVIYGSDYSCLENQEEKRPGFDFVGWVTEDDINHDNLITYTSTVEILKNTKLIPIYEEKEYNVTYIFDNGKENEIIKIKYNENYVLLDAAKRLNSFNGWYKDLNDESSKIDNNSKHIIDNDIYLYAKWNTDTKILTDIPISNQNRVSTVFTGEMTYATENGEQLYKEQTKKSLDNIYSYYSANIKDANGYCEYQTNIKVFENVSQCKDYIKTFDQKNYYVIEEYHNFKIPSLYKLLDLYIHLVSLSTAPNQKPQFKTGEIESILNDFKSSFENLKTRNQNEYNYLFENIFNLVLNNKPYEYKNDSLSTESEILIDYNDYLSPNAPNKKDALYKSDLANDCKRYINSKLVSINEKDSFLIVGIVVAVIVAALLAFLLIGVPIIVVKKKKAKKAKEALQSIENNEESCNEVCVSTTKTTDIKV